MKSNTTSGSVKRQRLVKIASKRVQRLLSDIESLAKCSNKNNYEYSEEDIRKMMHAIRTKLRFLELSFNSKGNDQEKNLFRF